ncbi:MAG: pitrilysin family protein [Cyclobacteriaceae bacterium]
MKNPVESNLSNGIKLIHTPYPGGRVSHICLGLGIGSVNDPEGKEGLAHFFEHACFKGTGNRTPNKIFSAIESNGGEINAYTQKDKITFEISIPDEHLEKALDVLADMVFNSTFPDDKLEKEKQVILQELQEQQGSEDDYIEVFHSCFFKGHPLGRPIIGTESSVRSICRADISHYVENNLDAQKVVLSVVSNVPAGLVENLATKYFSTVPILNSFLTSSKRIPMFDKYVPFSQREVSEGDNNAFVMIGFPVASSRSVSHWACSLLLDELAGDFNGSRINRSLREKYALVYDCGLGYYSYGFNGVTTLSFSIDPQNIDTALELINNEVDQLSKGISNRKLAMCKKRMKGQLLLSNDDKQSVSVQIAEGYLDTGAFLPIEDKFCRIDMVNQYEIKRALGYFKPEKVSKLIYA